MSQWHNNDPGVEKIGGVKPLTDPLLKVLLSP